ncbi:hypothetical protein PULV_a1353 [Pseudoalteromonas ulvae UL12]|uniref:peptidylprolyl isomerase n=1 Tax=Pseudoalteromonas ulvae TaxID=107327 RepID=UPI00186B5A4F|nr:peptidylprolyl isomerase [Pseudoalteromonas ulvae]MBE0363848.1 hypothetical protein [Pseudoalteromonas ulvae UL12]
MRVLTLLVGLISLPIYAVTAHFSQQEIALLTQSYQQHSPQMSTTDVHNHLLEQQFLLWQAEQSQPQLTTRLSAVGFSTEYHVKRYLIDLIQHSQVPLTQPTLSDEVLAKYNAPWLIAQLGPYPANGQLNPETAETLGKVNIELGSQSLNFYHLYDSLSMQSRFKLHQGDSNYLHAEIHNELHYQQLASQINALEQHGLSLSHLTDIATAAIISPAMRAYLGVGEMMHSHSPVLEAIAKELTVAQINQFYRQNKAEFRFHSDVNASGVMFADQATALRFHHQASEHGFATARDTFKQPDIFAKYQNHLTRTDNRSNWLIQSAFNLPEQSLSPVIRTPQGQWLVIQTFDKTESYYPAQSETVRYLATKSLAKQHALARYQQAKTQWLKAL